VLEGATQFSRAPGLPTHNQYDEIAFDGVPAKVVRLNIANNWGGLLMSYSLSEVQFNMIPAQARTPVPASGSTDVLPNAIVTWRAGREAGQHTIYAGTDENAVADGSAPSVTSSTNSLDLTPLDLQMGETYYWRVDEVNEAEATTVWAGSVWSLSTAASVIVEDFESYGNLSPNRPFQYWLDGFGYSSDEFFTTGYGGNGTGAGIGHDIWSLSSPHYDGDLMETTSTISGSSQSMPFYYGNSGGVASQTERTFASPQDWTVGAAQTLSIAFRGQIGNTGTLYVIINSTKVTYPRDAANIAIGSWQAWNIDLSSVNTNLQSVTKLVIGVDGSNASGMVLIDDITLHAETGGIINPVDPGSNGLVALYTFEGNFNDSSGNGHDGTVVGLNGTEVIQDPTRGQVLGLPGGEDQFVEIGAVGISGTMPRTIACWAKADSTDITDWTLIFGFTGQADATGGNGSHFNLGSLGGPGGIGAHAWGWEETMISDQEGLDWHHYAMTYDGTTIAYFLDGAQIDSDLAKSNVQDLSPSGDRVHIGSRVTQTSSFPGSVDDAAIYDRVLSAEEVLWMAGVTTPIDKPF
ncbi:MAG: LamG domain-containing protein, partial [Phycisphaeraceae bacterium]|nr:LamG domain-containing protein [Phycisphaeraceae bacterium]